MHCLNYFATWHIWSSKTYEALNFQWKTVSDNSLMYPYRWKYSALALDSLSIVSQLHWKNWKRKHCLNWYVCDNWWNWAARIPQFLLEDNKTNSNSRKTWRLRVLVFVKKHCTDTRRRASAVTMHDGEQITAIKIGKLARSPKQNSLTGSESTGLKNCTALKWSTDKLNMYRNWSSSSFVYTACFCGRTVNRSGKVFIVALSDDQNLNDFKSILNVPPMWKELKKLWPFMNLVWPANNAAFSEPRTHKDRLATRCLWKGVVSFSTPRAFFPFRRTKKEYI